MSISEPSHPEKSKSLETVVQQVELASVPEDLDERRKLERKLLRKIDRRMSILMVIFILNYVDRNNVAAARLRGLEHDLSLQGQQYATVLSIFYVGYILMQVPSNMFLNYIGKPSKYISGCTIAWGVLCILMGIVHDFTGALIIRFFLGFIEAAFYPGALFLLSKWYKREELAIRTAFLYSGMIISTAFGSLIASGILDGMDGKLGRAAWRWLFYIEGSLTIFVAFCAMFILPDFPATTTWLSDQERQLAIKRMKEDVGADDEQETEKGGWATGLKLALTDPAVWLVTAASTSQNIALTFNIYFPTLCATLGFSPTVTLLLCAPPFIYAAVMTIVIGRHSDKTGERYFHLCIPIFGEIVGFVISICTMNTAARYFSLFLMAQSYSGVCVIYTWTSNSFARPPSKRAVAIAILNSVSQLGSLAGSYIWQTKWGPTYRNSYAICIAGSGCMIILLYIFRQRLAQMNRKLEEEERAKGIKEKGYRYLL